MWCSRATVQVCVCMYMCECAGSSSSIKVHACGVPLAPCLASCNAQLVTRGEVKLRLSHVHVCWCLSHFRTNWRRWSDLAQSDVYQLSVLWQRRHGRWRGGGQLGRSVGGTAHWPRAVRLLVFSTACVCGGLPQSRPWLVCLAMRAGIQGSNESFLSPLPASWCGWVVVPFPLP
jgi:hypothetical protein